MNRKKLISVGLTAAMLTGLLAGCGDSSQNSSQNGSGSEPVVLQWWGSFPENMGPNQVCEAFNKIDPNLQVEYTRFVNDDAGNTKLDVSLMSDSSIDVFLSLNDVLLNKRIDSGYAEPLDELFDKVGFNIKDDYDDAIEQRQKDGHYYSLPAKKMTSAILYNKDMFDAAGVAYPDADWTYDEFLDAATKLTHGEGNNKVYGYFFPGYDAGQPATSMLVSKLGADWMYTEDGTKAAIDTDDVKDVTEKYLERVEKGVEPSYVDVTTSYTDDMSINSKSEHKVEAMKFIKWYIEEGMDYVAPFARIPACKKYDEEKVASLIFGDKSDLFDMDSAKNIYLKGTDFSTRKNLAAATEVNTILTEEFDKAFAGAQSVDKTLANAQKRADEKIADEK